MVDVDAANLWNTFKNSMLQACDEICGKKKGRKTMEIRGDGIKCEGSKTTKVAHKMCKLDQRKTRLNIRISKIEQRKWLLTL